MPCDHRLHMSATKGPNPPQPALAYPHLVVDRASAGRPRSGPCPSGHHRALAMATLIFLKSHCPLKPSLLAKIQGSLLGV